MIETIEGSIRVCLCTMDMCILGSAVQTNSSLLLGSFLSSPQEIQSSSATCTLRTASAGTECILSASKAD